jgi:antirestriction protein ArdC
MSKQKIRGTESLDRVIFRKKMRLKEIEAQLGRNMEELPVQIPRMVLYTFLGMKQKPGMPPSMPGQLLSMALDNEKLQLILAELIDRIAEKLGIGLEKLATMFGWRKQKQEDNPDH